jgi:hypothetical protein
VHLKPFFWARLHAIVTLLAFIETMVMLAIEIVANTESQVEIKQQHDFTA